MRMLDRQAAGRADRGARTAPDQRHPDVDATQIDRKGRDFGIYLVAGLIIGPLVLFISLLLPRSRRPV
jgi:hypothetical protein